MLNKYSKENYYINIPEKPFNSSRLNDILSGPIANKGNIFVILFGHLDKNYSLTWINGLKNLNKKEELCRYKGGYLTPPQLIFISFTKVLKLKRRYLVR